MKPDIDCRCVSNSCFFLRALLARLMYPGSLMQVIIIALFLSVICSISHAENFDQSWTWRSTVQGLRYSDGTLNIRTDSLRVLAELQNLLRYSLSGRLGRFQLQFAYEIAGTWFGHSPISAGSVSPTGHPEHSGMTNVLNWRNEFIRTEKSSLNGDFERLQASWRCGKCDIDFGRQPISLGTSHFIGVLDVLAPFSPGYLDATFKPGIDALRLRTRAGETGEAELIFVPARTRKQRAIIGRIRYPVVGFDLEGIVGHFRRRQMLGIGWEGEKRGWNLWGEAVVFSRRADAERRRSGPSGYARSIIAGLERQIRTYTRMGVAGFYQDFGVNDPTILPEVFMDAPFVERWAYLGGRKYLLATYDQELHPLVSLSISTLLNLSDGSTLWQPRILFSIDDNSDFTLFACIGTGSDSGFSPSGPVVRSEFGSYPDGIGFMTRRFF